MIDTGLPLETLEALDAEGLETVRELAADRPRRVSL